MIYYKGVHSIEGKPWSETESQENDLDFVREIIHATTPELLSEGNNIKTDNIQRLGKNKQNSNKIRPLKVILPDESFKKTNYEKCKKALEKY